MDHPVGYHDCPKDGCDVSVPNCMPTCVTHWFALPRHVQSDLLASQDCSDYRAIRGLVRARRVWGDA